MEKENQTAALDDGPGHADSECGTSYDVGIIFEHKANAGAPSFFRYKMYELRKMLTPQIHHAAKPTHKQRTTACYGSVSPNDKRKYSYFMKVESGTSSQLVHDLLTKLNEKVKNYETRQMGLDDLAIKYPYKLLRWQGLDDDGLVVKGSNNRLTRGLKSPVMTASSNDDDEVHFKEDAGTMARHAAAAEAEERNRRRMERMELQRRMAELDEADKKLSETPRRAKTLLPNLTVPPSTACVAETSDEDLLDGDTDFNKCCEFLSFCLSVFR